MQKQSRNKLTAVFVFAGILPVLLLTAYFIYFSQRAEPAGNPNTPNVLKSEKNSAVSLTARNSWYLTMLLRKVELAGRMTGEVTAGVLKRPNTFFTQEDFKKIKTDPTGKFLWTPEKEAGVLFVCGGYKNASKDAKLPVLGSYLDNALSLLERNGAVIESAYIMTESAVRKYPWVKVDDLVKTGLLKTGNYKIKIDSLFSKEDASPFRLAGPDLNKGKAEIWTEAYWSTEHKSWMLSYFTPLYVEGQYKGVLGADVSLQKLLEVLIGKDQAKSFNYKDTFPALITKNGLLTASSYYGYDMLKIESFGTLQADLKSFGDPGLKPALAGVLKTSFWDSNTRDEELGGIENITLDKKDYYLAHFPLRTGGLTLGLFIPAENLEKSAAVSVVRAKNTRTPFNYSVLIAGLLSLLLALLIMLLLADYAGKRKIVITEEKAPEKDAAATEPVKVSAEKEYFEAKLLELSERNIELGAQLEKAREDLERKINEKPVDYRKIFSAGGKQNTEPDPNEYIKIEDVNEKIEEVRTGLTNKINELEKTRVGMEARLKEAQEEKVKLAEQIGESRKISFPKGGAGDREVSQHLSELQKANDVFRENFEKLKTENTELADKVKSLENEGRNLAGMLVSKFEEEKKNYIKKVEEQSKQLNVSASRVFELENKIKADSVKLVQMDPSRFVPLAEVNTRIESDRKNFVLKIQELESRLKILAEKPDPSRFVPLEKAKEEKAELVSKLQKAEQRLAELAGKPAKELLEIQAKVEAEQKAASEKIDKLEGFIETLKKENKTLSELAIPGGLEAGKNEETRIKAVVREKELQQRIALLTEENKKLIEAVNVTEGRKKETDRQAQSLILKVGDDQQALKAQQKELMEQNEKLKAERDAARKHYEILRKEAEKVPPGASTEEIIDVPRKKIEMFVLSKTPAVKPAPETESGEKEIISKPPEKITPKVTASEVKIAPAAVPFHVPVPASVPAASPVRVAAAPRAPADPQENNLLVVDDQGEVIKLFGDMLYNIGYSIYIARDSKHARQKLTMENYKNVIVNVNLAEGDYKEFFEAIKKGDPKFSERIVFFNNDEGKDKDFLAGKKILKSGRSEADIRKMMT